jgi:branched-chain amino acid transport system substrate-binding protein
VFNPSDVDATPQLSQIKATNPDAIIAWVVGQPLGVVLKGAKQLGMELPIVTSHGNLTPGFIESLADVQTGPLYMFGTKDLIWRSIPEGDPQKPIINKMQTELQAKYGKEGGIGTGTGYDAMLIFTEAIKRANSTDPAKIAQTIEGVQNLVGVVGAYNFSAQDHRGLKSSDAIPMVVQHGQLGPAQ